MANIIIPFPLRKFTENFRELQVDAKNLAECMETVISRYPGLSSILENRALLSIFINGKLTKDVWTSVMLNDDDEVSLIIPIAGG